MRLIKMLGLAVVVAAIGMAFIGASSASAQDKIVLCKKLVTLCGTGELWTEGTKVYALAENPELKAGSFTPIKCEDSLVTAELAETIGSPLNFKNPTAKFGKLPTPTLGANCTGSCTNGAEENVHAFLENLQLEVEAVDKYSLKGTGLALLLHCPFNVNCIYRGENILVPVAHTGKHAADPGVETLPLAKYEVTLTRQTAHENPAGKFTGSLLCPETATWTADYVLYKAELGVNSGLAWPSLDL